ncbi:hypothetical protein DFS34DRAFT_603363 [Phlyctochytrium arcticum]|nr:hypothetical protein DFS34DRAFT_603363 [Phlyctochytrium arcticum]
MSTDQYSETDADDNSSSSDSISTRSSLSGDETPNHAAPSGEFPLADLGVSLEVFRRIFEANLLRSGGFIQIYRFLLQDPQTDHQSLAIKGEDELIRLFRRSISFLRLQYIHERNSQSKNAKRLSKALYRPDNLAAFHAYLNLRGTQMGVGLEFAKDFVEAAAKNRKKRKVSPEEPERADQRLGKERRVSDTVGKTKGVLGLENLLAGKEEANESDCIINGTNLSQLFRHVVRDILLDQQQPKSSRAFDEKDPLTAVALSGGLLISRCLPLAFEQHISVDEWDRLHSEVAGSDDLWTKIADIDPGMQMERVTRDIEMSKLDEDRGINTFHGVDLSTVVSCLSTNIFSAVETKQISEGIARPFIGLGSASRTYIRRHCP